MAPISMGTGILSRGESERGVELITHLMLKMSGFIHLIPIYNSMVQTGTNIQGVSKRALQL
jgi:hypothetical protein